MPLYELVGIVRPGKLAEVREIAKTTSTVILNAGGVIRGITNWGTFLLPKPQRRHNALHHFGHHFIVRFDSSSRTQHAVRRTLGLDPRMIRYSVVKLGSTLDQIKDVAGQAQWNPNVDNGRLLGER
ncbi:putative 37S ribosomal protein [Elsinoe australis]|uniref:Small ribosomal subunit protein bS6m n=1 Tax=Elsinoe australis TaxID=40998 RepID=A0A4U7BCR8_9PEZI|nr:putative 37S ribosomal protein [Elsinoe australis]